MKGAGICLPFFLASLIIGLMLSGHRVLAQEGVVSSKRGLGITAVPHVFLLFHNGRLTVDIKEGSLENVLREVAHQSGITLLLDAPISETVTVSFYDLSLDEGVRRLIKNQNFFLLYAPTLREVRILTKAKEGPVEETSVIDQASLRTLINLALESGQGLVRMEALAAIKATGDKKAIASLTEALQNEDADVRERAVEALVEVAGKEALEPLLNASQEDPNEYVRGSAVEALTRLNREIAVAAATEALGDETSWVRHKAVRILSEIGEEKTVEE